jgi:hypothetical protein
MSRARHSILIQLADGPTGAQQRDAILRWARHRVELGQSATPTAALRTVVLAAADASDLDAPPSDAWAAGREAARSKRSAT